MVNDDTNSAYEKGMKQGALEELRNIEIKFKNFIMITDQDMLLINYLKERIRELEK